MLLLDDSTLVCSIFIVTFLMYSKWCLQSTIAISVLLDMGMSAIQGDHVTKMNLDLVLILCISTFCLRYFGLWVLYLCSLMQEPFCSVPLVWIIQQDTLASRLRLYENMGWENLISHWRDSFRRADVIVFPDYSLPVYTMFFSVSRSDFIFSEFFGLFQVLIKLIMYSTLAFLLL